MALKEIWTLKVVAVLEQAAIDAEKALAKVGGDDLPAKYKATAIQPFNQTNNRRIVLTTLKISSETVQPDAAVAAVEA